MRVVTQPLVILTKGRDSMNSEAPNGEETGNQIGPGEATEIRRLFEEAQKHAAQIHRQNMIKRMKYGKAAKKAQREQQQ